MGMPVYGYVYLTAGACGGQRMLNLLWLEVQGVGLCPTWVLGTWLVLCKSRLSTPTLP